MTTCGGNICLNGGSCQSTSTGFACFCTNGYTGNSCQTCNKNFVKNWKI